MATTNHSSLLLHLALLSYDSSLAEFGSLLVYYINENLHKICIPKLTLTLKASQGFRFTDLDSRGAIDGSQLTLTIKDIVPQTQNDCAQSASKPQFVASKYQTLPIFEYDGIGYMRNTSTPS